MKVCFSLNVLSIFLLFPIFIIFFEACTFRPKPSGDQVSHAVLLDNIPGSCPYLTYNTQGNIVLSWVRQRDSLRAVYCYAISNDEGQTFSEPVEVPASRGIHPHSENLPKIIFKPSGEAIAVWGEHSSSSKNPYAGIIYYAQSFDEGKSWGDAQRLVHDTTAVDQRYFDVALLPGNEVGIIWLDSRKTGTKPGSSLYMAKTSGKNGFTGEHQISGPCCECCRTDLFVDESKNIHVLYRAILNDSIRDMVHAVSTDEGNTFSQPVKISNDNWVINGCPHTGPAMTKNNDGLYFAWYTAGSGTGVYYNSSSDNGRNFSEKKVLSGNTGRHPQIVKLTSGEIAIVWDENFKIGEDYKSRIGYQSPSRSESGEKHYLTPDSISATFPVISSLRNGALVAYTGSVWAKSHIYCQRLMFKN